MIKILDKITIDKGHKALIEASIEFEIEFDNLQPEDLIKLGAVVSQACTNFKVYQNKIRLDYGFASGTLVQECVVNSTNKVRKLIDQLFFCGIKSEIHISLNSFAELNSDFKKSEETHDEC